MAATAATNQSPIKIGTEITSIPFHCPNCDAYIGEYVLMGNEVRLDANGWLIADGKRYCHRCGRPIHMKPPRDPWPTLVERYLTRQLRCQKVG